jgi:hypothetical protein
VLQRLVRIGRPEETPGTGPTPGTGTDNIARQRLQLDDFPLNERRIVQELRNSRLLRLETDSRTNKETVQIAQDDFLRSWKRLQQWLLEDREFLVWLASLRVALENWQRDTPAWASRERILMTLHLLLKDEALASAQKWLKDRYTTSIRRAQLHRDNRQAAEPQTGPSSSPSPTALHRSRRHSENVDRLNRFLRGAGGTTRNADLAKLKGEPIQLCPAFVVREYNESIARDRLRDAIFSSWHYLPQGSGSAG